MAKKIARARLRAGRLAKTDDVIPPGWRELSATTLHEVSGGMTEISPTSEAVVGEYERSLWVYAAVSAKARFCAALPWVLKRKRKGKDEVIGEHEVLDLMERPAPGVTWSDFAEACVTYLELAGRLPIEKSRDGESDSAGPVKQLHPLQPHKTKVIVSGSKGITGFVYSPDLSPQKFDASDVCYLTYFDPLREFGGVGGMYPAWVSNLLDRNAREWNARFFKNGAHPDGIVMADKQIAPAIKARIEADFLGRHKGTRKGRGVEVLEHGMKFQEVGITHRELQFDRMMRMSREEIHAAFGVPPVLSGLLADVNYATAQVQLSIFRDHRCIPLITKLLNALTWSVVDEFDEELYLEVDRTRAKLADEQAAEYTSALAALAGGLVSRDEARGMVGREPMPNDDKKLVTVFAYDLETGVVTIDEAREAKGLGPHPNRTIGVLTVPEARIELGIMTAGPSGFSGGAPSVPGAPRMPAAPKPSETGAEGEPGEPAAKGVNGHAKRRRIHPADFDGAVLIRRP